MFVVVIFIKEVRSARKEQSGKRIPTSIGHERRKGSSSVSSLAILSEVSRHVSIGGSLVGRVIDDVSLGVSVIL